MSILTDLSYADLSALHAFGQSYYEEYLRQYYAAKGSPHERIYEEASLSLQKFNRRVFALMLLKMVEFSELEEIDLKFLIPNSKR